MTTDQDDPHYWWQMEDTPELRARFKQRPLIKKVSQYHLQRGEDSRRVLHWYINCWPAMIVLIPYDDVMDFAKFNAAAEIQLGFKFDPMSDADWAELLDKGVTRTRQAWYGRIPYERF